MKWIAKILAEQPKPITDAPFIIGVEWVDKVLKGETDGEHERVDAFPTG